MATKIPYEEQNIHVITPEIFCYWLQGFIEISNPKEISPEQLEIIKNHLNLVFTKYEKPKLAHFC